MTLTPFSRSPDLLCVHPRSHARSQLMTSLHIHGDTENPHPLLLVALEGVSLSEYMPVPLFLPCIPSPLPQGFKCSLSLPPQHFSHNGVDKHYSCASLQTASTTMPGSSHCPVSLLSFWKDVYTPVFPPSSPVLSCSAHCKLPSCLIAPYRLLPTTLLTQHTPTL